MGIKQYLINGYTINGCHNGCQRVDTPGLGSRLSTYRPTTWSNNWQCNQHTSFDQTRISCAPVASPGLKPKGRVCVERMLRRSQTGQAWLELQRQQMQRRRDWGAQCANSLRFFLFDAGSRQYKKNQRTPSFRVLNQ